MTKSPQLEEISSFKEKLRSWILKYQPSVASCRDLLQLLREEGLDVPLSVETLITSRDGFVKRTVHPGEYVHIGLKRNLQNALSYYDSTPSELYIDIGVDGLPLYKGTYIGVGKPTRVDNFLHDFMNEYSQIRDHGIEHEGKITQCSIRAFICDAPARAFLQDIKGHTSFNGCSKCTQVGKRIEKTNTFSVEKGLPRSDKSFSDRLDPGFHQPFSQNFQLGLEKLGIKMISQFPVEPMHLVEVLFLATSADGCTELEFTLALSRALKAAKNKHFKSICLNKKNNKENC
ncbi:uncharacterized protein LOC142229537 [Haematobia irritans]|uniref:uncharacterized protein LOC142229537 n=1 Tax=Haematobia irritans TaxID=7368 RepID=UPI003F4F63DA